MARSVPEDLRRIKKALIDRAGEKPPFPMLHDGPLVGPPPTVILDKSAFQGLSRSEHLWFHHYFFENLTPVLVHEILGDLAKTNANKPPKEKVQELAGKIGGSGNRTNMNYRALCLLSLMGEKIPMRGQSVIDRPHLFREEDGSTGAFIEIGPLNRLLMQLADGQSTSEHEAFAANWRAACASLSLDSLKDFLRENRVVIMKTRAAAEIPNAVDATLAVSGLADHWVALLLVLTNAGPSASRIVGQRWAALADDGFARFAPYACHCLRTLLMLFVACRDGHLKMQPTHLTLPIG